ncbi:DUF4292 domain-containing protein [Capnocytophaga sp. oral taxon 878]|uniref:DUF4292 domain-containing protein n=1 Tax=Capnocytophaga sp. oral taxon 878 TaxID=1316596 RepID=UPI000D02938D|nr:DUF4292 domain-containing protein [Capnocytophaga sp. oral taxon 878]AVM50975.1 DUF4292 domain-containing protein [Capnocytophaga sp. oral taxon 878]
MKRIILLFVVLLLASCKTKQAVVEPAGKASIDKHAKEIIIHHLESSPTFKTLSGSVQVSYTNGDKEQSIPLTFRMEKDRVIWLSAPLGVAKVMATPEKAEYYNRLDNSFFSGDFSYISSMLDIEVGFNELQNLLLGNTFYPFSFENEGIITLLKEDNNLYNIQVEDESPIRTIYRFLPDSYRVQATEVRHLGTTQQAMVTYTYQQVDKLLFPLTVKINTTEGEHKSEITLEFKNLSLDKELSFPFKIPSGMKEITVKKQE